MMIDFALEAQRTEGKAPPKRSTRPASSGSGPIMMTTMAALMGALPIALGLGAAGRAGRWAWRCRRAGVLASSSRSTSRR